MKIDFPFSKCQSEVMDKENFEIIGINYILKYIIMINHIYDQINAARLFKKH